MLNYVPRAPYVPTCLACLRALRTHVSHVISCLCFVHAFIFSRDVPLFFMSLMCLQFFTCLTCPHFLGAFLALSFLQDLRAFSRLHFLRALRAFLFFTYLPFIYVYANNELTNELTCDVDLCYYWIQSSINVYQLFSLLFKLSITFNAEENTRPIERLGYYLEREIQGTLKSFTIRHNKKIFTRIFR